MEDPATSVTSSLWASLNSWFTSTVFFILLNLMIATIVFTSNLPDNNTNNNNQQQQQQEDQEQHQDQKKNTNHDHNNNNQPQISRSHSILNRLKSFNLYPQQHQQDESSDTHYHQHPLEVAATQYVFPENDYQHFDSSFITSESRAEHVRHVTHAYDFPQVHQETSTFDFDPTRKDSGRDTGSNFEPTWQEVRRNKEFDFDPTPNGADPTHKEVRRNEAYNFDPIRNGTDLTRPGIGKGTGSGFEESDEEHEFESLDEVYSKLKGGGHDRTKSDGNIRQKAPTSTKMKKSASLKVGFTHPEEEEVEMRRPATVKDKRSTAKVKVADDDDVEVDSRADDFINRFKNDLMLQRMESIMKTKGASNRGGGN